MNNFINQVKTALSNLKRNLAMTLSSSLAVTVTLILIMFFIAVALNINSVSDGVDKSVEIFAQIDKIAKEKDYSKIKKEIEDIPHVKSVDFSSKEEQKEIFLKQDGNEEYESMFEDGNPLSPAFIVEADDGKYIKQINSKVAKIKGISSAEYGGEAANTMLESFNKMKIWGGIIVAGLVLLALFLISNTIEITINARKNEIAIMRQVGATNTYIKIPFVIEGLIIGIIGAIIPILIAVFGYEMFYGIMNGVFFSDLFPMVKPEHFSTYMLFGLSGLGMLVGVIGSWISVTKYLRWKR